MIRKNEKFNACLILLLMAVAWLTGCGGGADGMAGNGSVTTSAIPSSATVGVKVNPEAMPAQLKVTARNLTPAFSGLALAALNKAGVTVSVDSGDLVILYAVENLSPELEGEVNSALANGQTILIDSDGSDSGILKVARISSMLGGLAVDAPLAMVSCLTNDTCSVTALSEANLRQVVLPQITKP